MNNQRLEFNPLFLLNKNRKVNLLNIIITDNFLIEFQDNYLRFILNRLRPKIKMNKLLNQKTNQRHIILLMENSFRKKMNQQWRTKIPYTSLMENTTKRPLIQRLMYNLLNKNKLRMITIITIMMRNQQKLIQKFVLSLRLKLKNNRLLTSG